MSPPLKAALIITGVLGVAAVGAYVWLMQGTKVVG
jgi:hypothetical protein